jgi:hypothetical protein
VSRSSSRARRRPGARRPAQRARASSKARAERVRASAAAGVGRVGGALEVAQALQAVDGLARGLLGDAQAAAELDGGGAVRADGLEDEAVPGAQVGVALAGELGVHLVDEGAEGHEQPQRELVARRVS